MKVSLHIYQGSNSVFRIGDTVSTGIAGAVLARGGEVIGISNDGGQTILVCMNVLENICAFGGTIQGSLVRQRVSNHGVLLSGQADTPQHQLEPLGETTPGTLCSNPHTLQRL